MLAMRVLSAIMSGFVIASAVLGHSNGTLFARQLLPGIGSWAGVQRTVDRFTVITSIRAYFNVPEVQGIFNNGVFIGITLGDGSQCSGNVVSISVGIVIYFTRSTPSFQAAYQWSSQSLLRADAPGALAPGDLMSVYIAGGGRSSVTSMLMNVSKGWTMPFQLVAPSGTTICHQSAQWKIAAIDVGPVLRRVFLPRMTNVVFSEATMSTSGNGLGDLIVRAGSTDDNRVPEVVDLHVGTGANRQVLVHTTAKENDPTFIEFQRYPLS